MEDTSKKKVGFSSFSGVFWLVIVFEFFERGSYYGMMSVLSVYFTDHLLFSKESDGVIKGIIQPLLYFLPIISGALADRYGYRLTLMVAFTLLGAGYFLTSQVTDYTLVFIFLAVMGLGAGTFKPIISGSIARVTDKTNSSLGFGIYYWSINLGAFLFPLILVPYLKNNLGWEWVIIASAIGTGAMLIPTILFFKEPPKQKDDNAKEAKQFNLLGTVASAFEIIYSPFVLLYQMMKKSSVKRIVIGILTLGFVFYAVYDYVVEEPFQAVKPEIGVKIDTADSHLVFTIHRNMSNDKYYELKESDNPAVKQRLTIYKPDSFDQFVPKIVEELKQAGYPSITTEQLQDLLVKAQDQLYLQFVLDDDVVQEPYAVTSEGNRYLIRIAEADQYPQIKEKLLQTMHTFPGLIDLSQHELDSYIEEAQSRDFFFLFIGLLFVVSLLILSIERKFKSTNQANKVLFFALTVGITLVIFWILPGLSVFTKILTSIIFFTISSLFLIEYEDGTKFRDHFKFLLMIFLYSGFWILYFQMFDSVLWYVKAYVDATTLNNFVNGIVDIGWKFDVEHVTVINAGTIILLQLIIAKLVQNLKPLPTMIGGITLGTLGMLILSFSTSIWVFMAGIVLFSVGEMTAHPKFISYIGQTAPRDRVAMYMGYIFLYGVIGSSIGSVLGANLYVYFVDTLRQPDVLWLIFSGIGAATIVCLLLYNQFIIKRA